MNFMVPVSNPPGGNEIHVIQELMSRADQRGYVTFEDVLELLDEDSDDVTAIEAVLDELDELGIELRQLEADSRSDMEIDPNNAEFQPEEEVQDPGVGDINAVSADDPVGLYFRQMAQEPLLTAQEEIELAKRIELGREATDQIEAGEAPFEDLEWMHQLIYDGQAAREHLGRANTRLVVSIAKRYMGQGLPFPDLIQEGNVGLMRAVDKYDYKRGNRFSTYATWWIRQAITRALAQKTRTIRIPLHMTERIRQMYRTAQILEQTLGHRPTPEEIAQEMELPAESVRGMMDASQHAIALERPVGDDGDSEFGDFIEDKASPQPTEIVTHNLLREHLELVLARLPERESHILQLRYGLLDGETHTLEEVGKEIGVTRERVRQLEAQALNRLRHSSAHSLLQDYLIDL